MTSHRNDIAPAPTSRRRLAFITGVATLGALGFGYDTGVISGALPFMTLDESEGGLSLTPVTEGIVSSSLIFGAAFGALLGGKLSDARGRKLNLLLLAIVFFVGAIGTALAPTIGVMVAFRFILGFAVGGASATVPTFIAEMAPADRRGKLVSRNELMIVTGQLIAYISNAVIANVFGGEGGGWRWMLAIAAFPAAALFIGMLFVPESPRWYASKGRYGEALAVLKTIRDGDVNREFDQIKDLAQRTADERNAVRAELRVPWVRRILIIGVVFGVVVQLTGVNSVMYYAPTILQATGMGTNAALTATIANGVVAVLGTFYGIWLLGRVGRRPMLLVGESGIVGSLVLLGLAFLLPESLGRSLAVLLFMLTFLFFMQSMVAVVFWLLMSEIFPLKIRGFAIGTAVFAQWLSNAAVTFFFPIMIDALGGATFFIFAAINALTLLFFWKFIPETRGRSLEGFEEELRTGNIQLEY